MEICDWCGAERSHGKVIVRSFASYSDVSWSIGWDCFAKLQALRKHISDSSATTGQGRIIQKEEEGGTEEDTEEEARKRAFGDITDDTMRRGFEDIGKGKHGWLLQGSMS